MIKLKKEIQMKHFNNDENFNNYNRISYKDPEFDSLPDEEKVKYLTKGQKRAVMSCATMFFGFIALIFVVIGVLMIKSNFDAKSSLEKSHRQCSELVEGTVTKINSKVFTETDSDDNVTERTGYAPEFTYTYNGREYTYKAHYYKDRSVYEIGDKEEIYINPDDPAQVYIPDYDVRNNRGNGNLIIGIIIIIVSVGVFLINIIATGIKMYKKSDY